MFTPETPSRGVAANGVLRDGSDGLVRRWVVGQWSLVEYPFPRARGRSSVHGGPRWS